MNTDFTTLRHHLEQAQLELQGSDDTSAKLSEALDLLIEAATTAEHQRERKLADILTFPTQARASQI